MGYEELLRALEEEARAQARAVVEEARREGERVLAEARRAAAADREATLARLAADLGVRRARAAAAATSAAERRVLVEERALLGRLRDAVASRLAAAAGPELTLRLLDEVLPETGDAPLAVEVDPGEEEVVRAHLLARRPAAPAAVRSAPARRGGVLVRVGDRVVLDNTLPSRLERAWPLLEGEAAALLFGIAHGAV